MAVRFHPWPSFFLLSSLILNANIAAAQQGPAQTSVRERAQMAQQFAAERLFVWQKRLKLEDWHITVQTARATELRPQTVGNIHWAVDKKTAVIRVLDPVDYRLQGQAMLEDIEFTVVHELIHLELVPLLSDVQRNEANRREEEYTVNHMAEALLQLDRGR